MAAPQYPRTLSKGAFAGQTFTSHRQYLNALARNKGFKNFDEQRTIRASERKHPEETRREDERARERGLTNRDVLRFAEEHPGTFYDARYAYFHHFNRGRDVEDRISEELLDALYSQAVLDGWDTAGNGPYANLLRAIGMKEDDDFSNVGETP